MDDSVPRFPLRSVTCNERVIRARETARQLKLQLESLHTFYRAFSRPISFDFRSPLTIRGAALLGGKRGSNGIFGTRIHRRNQRTIDWFIRWRIGENVEN